jgi:hypothetical protein
LSRQRIVPPSQTKRRDRTEGRDSSPFEGDFNDILVKPTDPHRPTQTQPFEGSLSEKLRLSNGKTYSPIEHGAKISASSSSSMDLLVITGRA